LGAPGEISLTHYLDFCFFPQALPGEKSRCRCHRRPEKPQVSSREKLDPLSASAYYLPTIALGLIADDGIVITVDRQETEGDQKKSAEN
jgi:hypothetical protein